MTPGHGRSVDRIEIVKQRLVWDVDKIGKVLRFCPIPCELALDSDALVKQVIGAEYGIDSTVQRLRLVVAEGRGAGRRGQGGGSEAHINLLGAGKAGQDGDCRPGKR